jgi:hypothetical protein
MSSQCWCFTCSGGIVSRNTFIAHGRKEKPDRPTRKRRLEMISVPPEVAPQIAPVELDPPALADHDFDDPWATILERMEGEIGKGQLTGAQVSLLLLDWMSSHKVTDAAARCVWSIVSALMPEDADMPSFYSVKERLRQFEEGAVRRIDICPNDCIAYYDTIHLSGNFACKNSHRTKCPKCDVSRYVRDPKTGRDLPAKSIFHFPLKSYVRSLYDRPDLSAYLWHDCGDNPEGHVTRSRGFKKKVTDNPCMASDNRNLALVGTTDGVPFFDDQIRGCWPFFFR